MSETEPPASPKTLYLIDGYASIFRAYYAIRRPLFSPVTGEQTQGVLVFAQMLLKLFTRLKPDYVVVALDSPGGTFRDDLHLLMAQQEFGAGSKEEGDIAVPDDSGIEWGPPGITGGVAAGYKGTRRATPDGLIEQVPRMLQLLELLGIPVISRPGLEADDIIATLTDRLRKDPENPDLRVRIVTRDKDMEQLLDDRVTLFDIHEETETDVAALWTKRGVTPQQIVDLLALTGDTVDNIPGVAGIGPRTAAKLIQRFGTLEQVLDNAEQLTETVRTNLLRAAPRLPLSRQLITLMRDPDLPFSLESARTKPLPTDDLALFFEELGLHRLKAQFLKR